MVKSVQSFFAFWGDMMAAWARPLFESGEELPQGSAWLA
jgi:hypothetical protein